MGFSVQVMQRSLSYLISTLDLDQEERAALLASLRELRSSLPNRGTASSDVPSIYDFGEALALGLESASVLNARSIASQVIRARIDLVFGSATERAAAGEGAIARLQSAVQDSVAAAGIIYVDCYVDQILQRSLPTRIYEQTTFLFAQAAAQQFGSPLATVTEAKRYFGQVELVAAAIAGICKRHEPRFDELVETWGKRRGILQTSIRPEPHFQTDGCGLFLRRWRKSHSVELSLWTALGSLSVYEGDVTEPAMQEIESRFGLVQTAPTHMIPMWDQTDTLYEIRRNVDGTNAALPKQRDPVLDMPAFLVEALWHHAGPEYRRIAHPE